MQDQKYKIRLAENAIPNEDIDSLCDWLKTYPKLTKGNLTLEFEKKFAEYMGVKYAVFVNSGSSAILLGLWSLIETGRLSPGDKVIVPALCWATDYSHVVHLGLKPVICDCNLQDLSLDLDHLDKLLNENDIKAVILVSVLGLSPNMDEILQKKDKYGFALLEDVCESLGSTFGAKKLGAFGDLSFVSTYCAHQLCTIEGGIIFTNDWILWNSLVSCRSHGWMRDNDQSMKETVESINEISDFYSPYTFYSHGFNLRNTDIAAFLGLRQLDRLENIVETREANYYQYRHRIQTEWKPFPFTLDRKCSNFAYPILSFNRDEIAKALIDKGIETRPLIAGSIERQPVFKGEQKCHNAGVVHSYGMYIPNHPSLTSEQIDEICTTVNNCL